MRIKFLLSLAVLLVMIILSACSGSDFKADHKYAIEPFEFTNQHNEKVSLDDLKGKVWLAQFVFANCTSVCPPMMANMAEVDRQLGDAHVTDYKIVSFSIDPDHDTPEVLQEYLDMFDVQDQSKWEMLTGFSQETISNIALKSFKTLVKDDPNSDQVIHGTAFGLVDQEGQVVKLYGGYQDVPFEQIVSDMKALIKSGS